MVQVDGSKPLVPYDIYSSVDGLNPSLLQSNIDPEIRPIQNGQSYNYMHYDLKSEQSNVIFVCYDADWPEEFILHGSNNSVSGP